MTIYVVLVISSSHY